VSSTDQDLSIQKATLTAAGCAIIREEKVSGTSTEGREELKTQLQFLREGDTLGYFVDRNVAIEVLGANGRCDRLPALARKWCAAK